MIYKMPKSYTASLLVLAMNVADMVDPTDRFQMPGGERLTPAEYREWFRKCLARKINRGQVVFPKAEPSSEFQNTLRRDAARLKGYGGFGKILENPLVRRRLNADHVHFYASGAYRVCSDSDCE